MRIDAGRFTVRLAESDADLDAALRLRYRVFVEEMGAGAKSDADGRESDRFDEHCEHLILIDREGEPPEQVVGAYRMLTGSAARAGPGFYSAGEYDLSVLEPRMEECLEVGRTCVAEEFRGGTAAQLLWAGLASYVFDRNVGLLFGCASFPGTDLKGLALPLSFLHHHHLASDDLRARAREPNRAEMDILPLQEVDRTAAAKRIPSLIKGYLRLGGVVGDGAYLDHAFNVTDVFLAVDVHRTSERQRAFYRDRLAGLLSRAAS